MWKEIEIKSFVKRIVPNTVLSVLFKPIAEFKERFTGIPVAPPGTDWVGYEALIKFIKINNILSIDGDLVEIGTFLGGGAYKLSKFLKNSRSAKKLYVIDVFDPRFDLTANNEGETMATLYLNSIKRFGGKAQCEIFHHVTRSCENIIVLKEDSKKVKIPTTQICFAFIDGNHSPEYVRNDFELLWDKLSPGGCIAFHDYRGDLPETTAAIDYLLKIHSNHIQKTFYDASKWILFVLKILL